MGWHRVDPHYLRQREPDALTVAFVSHGELDLGQLVLHLDQAAQVVRFELVFDPFLDDRRRRCVIDGSENAPAKRRASTSTCRVVGTMTRSAGPGELVGVIRARWRLAIPVSYPSQVPGASILVTTHPDEIIAAIRGQRKAAATSSDDGRG